MWLGKGPHVIDKNIPIFWLTIATIGKIGMRAICFDIYYQLIIWLYI